MLKLHAETSSFFPHYSVPPIFNKPGEDADAATLPGFGADLRDVIINNPISLYCETNAVPPPMLTWYKDGQLLTSSDKVLILPGDTNKETMHEKKKNLLAINTSFYLAKVAECCRSPELRLKTRAGTHVSLSTKQERIPFSMMSEFCVSKSSKVRRLNIS